MKNRKAILLLFLANTLSGFSQGITVIAIPWYFNDTLSQPGEFGQLYLFVTFISLFWGLYVGTLVDRYSRKNLFLIENLIGFVCLLLAGLFCASAGTPLPILVGAVFAITFWIYNLHYPSLYAFAQEMLERENYSRITAYIEIQGQLTTMIAGALAAVLLLGAPNGVIEIAGYHISMPFRFEAWSLTKVFLFDGCTYLLSAIIISLISYEAIAVRKRETGGVLTQLMIGLSFLKKNPLLFVFGNAAYFIFVTIMVANFWLFPNFISSTLEGTAADYSFAEMCYAIGAVFAGLLVRYVFSKSNAVFACICLSAMAAVTFFLLFAGANLQQFFLLILFLAMANSGSRIMRISYLLERIPNQYIGRTNSVFFIINVFFRLLCIALFSTLFFTENVRYTFLVFAILCLIAVVALLVKYRDLVQLETAEE